MFHIVATCKTCDGIWIFSKRQSCFADAKYYGKLAGQHDETRKVQESYRCHGFHILLRLTVIWTFIVKDTTIHYHSHLKILLCFLTFVRLRCELSIWYMAIWTATWQKLRIVVYHTIELGLIYYTLFECGIQVALKNIYSFYRSSCYRHDDFQSWLGYSCRIYVC